MALIQIILIIFLLFALSRVILRFRDRQITSYGSVFWAILFLGAIFGVLFPNETSLLARILGIGRGADLVIYASIVIIFYLVFRLYVAMEDLRHEITELIRQIALQNHKLRKPSR